MHFGITKTVSAEKDEANTLPVCLFKILLIKSVLLCREPNIVDDTDVYKKVENTIYSHCGLNHCRVLILLFLFSLDELTEVLNEP